MPGSSSSSPARRRAATRSVPSCRRPEFCSRTWHLARSAFSFGVALGDVDGDGDLDAYVANHARPRPVRDECGVGESGWCSGGYGGCVCRLRSNSWFGFNDGAGGFTAGAGLGSANGRGVALGDVDGDGDLDAYVANSGANVVWVNQGGVQARTEGVFVAGPGLGSASSFWVALGDVDGDGDLDAYVANFGARMWCG